jgi:acyl-CoA thioesterase FadM
MAHFNSFIRIPFLVLRQMVSPLPAMDPLDTDTIQLRVWPNNIDFNLHLNNARHLSVMDYGRVRLLARGGVLKPILRARWVPVVGDVWITYRRSLPLWAGYTLATRLVCWDERWFYIEQTFIGDEGLVAIGWVKGALRDKSGAIAPQRVMDLVRSGIVSPPLPEALHTLNGLARDRLRVAS